MCAQAVKLGDIDVVKVMLQLIPGELDHGLRQVIPYLCLLALAVGTFRAQCRLRMASCYTTVRNTADSSLIRP